MNGDDRIDKKQVQRAFSRAASSYDQVAVLQREIGQRMLERLQYVKLQPDSILDAGSGTGRSSADLLKQYRKSRVIALDLAPPMLQQARKRGSWLKRPLCVCGDIEALPLADETIDLVFSNLAMQWCNKPQQVIGEFMRVLRPGGLLMFSTLGPDTLKELRSAWSEVDDYTHTSDFVDMHDLGDNLLHSRFADPVMDTEYMTLTYPDVPALVRDLKMLGAQNASQQRPRGMMGKQRWQSMCQAYEQWRDADQRLPATYEVIYGHAWKTETGATRPLPDGEVHVPVDLIGR